MNSDKHRPQSQRGNAMIYILISLALLAALTAVLSRSGDSGSDNLSAEQNELLTTRTVAYVGSAKNVVDQMMMSGTPVSSLDYVRPNQASFDIAPDYNKVFHPSGGGLTLEGADSKIFASGLTPEAGWYMGRFNNVLWTPTSAPDVIFTAYGIGRALCENLNKKITGTTNIPVLGGTGDPLTYFIDEEYSTQTNADFTYADPDDCPGCPDVCPTCKGYPSLCVSNAAGDIFTYYNIMSGQ